LSREVGRVDAELRKTEALAARAKREMHAPAGEAKLYSCAKNKCSVR
jgi:hypothetical protein